MMNHPDNDISKETYLTSEKYVVKFPVINLKLTKRHPHTILIVSNYGYVKLFKTKQSILQ